MSAVPRVGRRWRSRCVSAGGPARWPPGRARRQPRRCCHAGRAGRPPAAINGSGSTYVALAMQQWVADAQTQGLHVNYIADRARRRG